VAVSALAESLPTKAKPDDEFPDDALPHSLVFELDGDDFSL
jgi:hypothetical protein